MKLKFDADNHVVVQDGKPVYVTEDGSDVAFDVVATTATIKRINGEAKTHREAKEAAETSLAAFSGITDPAAALKALDTMKNLDDKKLVDAGEVERVKAEAIKAVEEKYKPMMEERDRLSSEIRAEKIGGSFARSKFISDNIAIPPDMVESRFGSHFELKDGKVIAKDSSGNLIYSSARPGELADFDESLSELVKQYPYKDQILKGSGGSGGGASGGQGGQGGGGKKSVSRTTFDAMNPNDRQTHLKGGGEISE